MIEDNNYEPAIIVKMFEIEKGKQPELNEVYEALKSYLDDNEISKLREETKDVADITGNYFEYYAHQPSLLRLYS